MIHTLKICGTLRFTEPMKKLAACKTQPQTSAVLNILDKIQSLATVGLWLCIVQWMITEAGGSLVPTVPIALAIIFALLYVRLKYLAMHTCHPSTRAINRRMTSRGLPRIMLFYILSVETPHPGGRFL